MTLSGGHSIVRLLDRPHLAVLGINSGTSLNGLDLALIRIGRSGDVRLSECRSFPFPQRIAQTLRHLATESRIEKSEAAHAHIEYSRWMASCVRRFQKNLPKSGRIDLIGVHGQTIGHFPAQGKGKANATWQIGAPSVMAQETGIVTVGDFRISDVAAGGMGAPLSGYYHHLMFGEGHVILNLGGIANMSASRTRRGRLEILAFDIGPANMILDGLSQMLLGRDFDKSGAHAARGEASPQIVRRAFAHPYFRRRPPKTCGREEFGLTAIRAWFPKSMLTPRRANDCLATALAITAGVVTRAVTRWVGPFTQSRSLVLSGGGALNKTLVDSLSRSLPGWAVALSSTRGFPPQTVEPAGFALLAYETIHARAGNLGGATGARPAVLGVLALPTRS